MELTVISIGNNTYINLLEREVSIFVDGKKYNIPQSGIMLKVIGKGARYIDIKLVELIMHAYKNPVIISSFKACRKYRKLPIISSFFLNLKNVLTSVRN